MCSCFFFLFFFFYFTLKSKNCTHKMLNASHLLQNEALHSKYDKHILKANIFALILIPLRLLCYFENCVCFSKSVLWNWKLSQRPRTSVWFCRFGVWLCCLRARFQKLCDKQRFSVWAVNPPPPPPNCNQITFIVLIVLILSTLRGTFAYP